MRQSLHVINLLYIAFVPVLAILIQGGLEHDFIFASFSDKASNYFKTISYFYVIVMVLMLSFLVKKEKDGRVLFAIVLSGPLAGLLITWLTGSRPINAIYNMYLIEGGSFILALIYQVFTHVKRIKNESGVGALLILPVLLFAFLGGFIRSVNFEYLETIYPGTYGYIALGLAIAFSFYTFISVLKNIDNAHGNSRFGGYQDRSNPLHQSASYEQGTPLVLLAAIVGFIAYAFHEKLMEMDWLMNLLK